MRLNCVDYLAIPINKPRANLLFVINFSVTEKYLFTGRNHNGFESRIFSPIWVALLLRLRNTGTLKNYVHYLLVYCYS